MFNKKTIKDIEPRGKRVLVRVDFNVPIENGVVQDDTRIRAALPTVQNLLTRGAAVLLCSHLGRPKDKPDPEYSLRPVAEFLGRLVKSPVKFVEECVGPKAQAAARSLKPGETLLLENTRFYPGEIKNDPKFSRQLAALADLYVNDAFGSAHRAHASTEGVAHYLPAVAGLLMEQEIRYLGGALAGPKRPFVAILGGAKVSDKIGVIRNLLDKADHLLIGGGMANTFFKAQCLHMADSLVEAEAVAMARELLASASAKLHLPVDLVIADAFDEIANHKIMKVGDLPAGWRALDIGPETVAEFSSLVKKAGTVVWNGPMGVFEMKPFAAGTFALAKAVAESDADSIVGGGDSVSALQQSGLADKITHLSTGGGASLEMLEGKVLPGLAALQDKD
ncbi:MAG TPA: phosphoglycerate kinase [Anaerolineales bacterium]|nr:phosphoglycerate kinase [Anaerolineales bacterium]